MSKMKATLAATFLTVVLALPGSAGVIGTPSGTPPPPPPPTGEGNGNVGDTNSQAAGDLNSQMLVDILLAALSWF